MRVIALHILVASRHACDTYWLPRSVCIINGKSVLRMALAFSIVSITLETSIVSERVHAIISRKKVHYTVKVHKTVLSPYICNVSTPYGIWTLRIKLFIKNVMKFTAKSESFVVAIHGFAHCALMPISRMYLPTVRCEMVSSDFCKSLAIFGAP
mgnify:CR=1 FL=1